MVTCFLVCLNRLTVQTLTLSLPFYLHVEFLFSAVISLKKKLIILMLTSVKQVKKKKKGWGCLCLIYTSEQNKWGKVRKENERSHQHKCYCNVNLFSALEFSPIPAAASVSRLLMIKETAGMMEFKVILHLYWSYVTMYMQAHISKTHPPLTTNGYTISLLPGRCTYTRSSNYLN